MANFNRNNNQQPEDNNSSEPHQYQHPRLLLAHSNSTIPSFRRTVDSARQFRDNLNTVMREIQPLVETARTVNVGVQNAISITSFLNTNSNSPRQQVPPLPQELHNAENSFVINLGEATPGEENVNAVQNNENVPPDEGVQDIRQEFDNGQNTPEAQQFLQNVLKYVPFILIFLGKAIYDYHDSLFILGLLFVTFAHTNSAVKKEATKRHRRNLVTLGIELLYIVACSLFLHFVFIEDLHNTSFLLSLVLIRAFTQPLTVGNMLWIVTITDFFLKLITVTVKILVTMLPGRILSFKKRGKVYLFIEALSQMYRSIATIQPWLHYLLESYQGPEKIVAVLLSAFYMIFKGTDLMSRLVLLKSAFFLLLQNVTVGTSPSKEQIQTAGDHCPICHDEYDSPVLLQCKHIFCENCVTTWFDREQTCPLCRAKIVDDPSWRDGSTTYFIQLY